MESIKTTISAIVPIYNTPELYLRACIESMQNQTLRESQIILVDDGSSEKCGIVCEEYAKKDSRITVIHKKNGGVSSARNEGLKYVEGHYLIHSNQKRGKNQSLKWKSIMLIALFLDGKQK